jgi:hypothetical protein
MRFIRHLLFPITVIRLPAKRGFALIDFLFHPRIFFDLGGEIKNSVIPFKQLTLFISPPKVFAEWTYALCEY